MITAEAQDAQLLPDRGHGPSTRVPASARTAMLLLTAARVVCGPTCDRDHPSDRA
jgi:hypothetical protein